MKAKQDQGATGMNYEQAVTYVFKDKHWLKKMLIGGGLNLLGFLILPALILSGYNIRTIRWVAKGNKESLPEWNDPTDLLVAGFKYAIVGLVYLLPFGLILGFLYFFLFGLPIFFSASGAEQNEGIALALALFSVFGAIPFQIVALVFVIFVTFVFPALAIRFASTNSIRACFELSPLYCFIRTNFGKYMIVALIIWALSYLAGVGLIFFFIGIFFTSFYAQLVGAHLEGQLSAFSDWNGNE
jgi:hypothetical protein